jgi:hypothetical protein
VSRYSLIGLHGAPRSGTSWLGALFDSHARVAYRYQPFFAYAFRGRVDARSNAADIARFFDDLYATDDAFVTQSGDARLARSAPTFLKEPATHLVYKEVRFHDLIEPLLRAMPDAKYIGIVRDPRAVLASWFNAPREFKTEWTRSAEWRHAPGKNAGLAENWFGFERWRELANLFVDLEKRYAERFRIVRYEALVADPSNVLDALFRFAGLAAGEQTARFIADSTSKDDEDPYGVYRRHGDPRIAGVDRGISDAILRELSGTSLERFVDA